MITTLRETATKLMLTTETARDAEHAARIMDNGGPTAEMFYRLAVEVVCHPEDVARDELAAHAENSRRQRRAELPHPDMSEILDRLDPEEVRRAAEGFLWIMTTIGQVLEDRDNVDTLTIIEEDLATYGPDWLPAFNTGQDPVAGRWWADLQGIAADRSVVQFEEQEDENGGPLEG